MAAATVRPSRTYSRPHGGGSATAGWHLRSRAARAGMRLSPSTLVDTALTMRAAAGRRRSPRSWLGVPWYLRARREAEHSRAATRRDDRRENPDGWLAQPQTRAGAGVPRRHQDIDNVAIGTGEPSRTEGVYRKMIDLLRMNGMGSMAPAGLRSLLRCTSKCRCGPLLWPDDPT
jgi:hypothetical protein